MNTTNILGRLARTFPLAKSSRPSSRRGWRLAARFESGRGLEQLEVRTLLSGVAITQLTDSTGGRLSLYPSISSDGAAVAFQSNADLTGENADENFEIFLFDDISGTLSQITHTTGGDSHVPSISGDGSRIAFHSSADPTGNNPDGNLEIFLFDAATGSLTQLTEATGRDSRDPVISSDGTTIAFESWANLTGKNTDRSREIFAYNIATGTLTQVTDGFSGQNQGASISADGTKVAFFDSDNRISLFDAATEDITQVASGFDPAISGDATKIVFDAGDEIRLTDMTTGNSRALAENSDLTLNRNPSIDSDGTRMVWESNGEIVMVDTAAYGYARLTPNTAAGESTHPSVDGHANNVVFQSSADLTGGNADGSVEIFMATVGGNYVDGVRLFYNSSVHDGNGPAVTEADFEAIATDKDPLHGGVATFANVSGYSRGINGLFIDVLNLPRNGAGISANDLQFSVGDGAAADGWTSVAPLDVGVFPNAGRNGTDRIFATFADGAIVDTWLRTTLLPTEDTGLLNAMTYFYGSVPGDTGAAFDEQSEFFGRDAADMQSVAADLFHTAEVASPNDLNRDGVVDAFDLQVIPLAGGGEVEPNVIPVLAPITIEQLTDSPTYSSAPAINSDGTKVVFTSAADFTGNNTDGNFEIFLFDAFSETLTQVTETTGGHSSAPSINRDGTRISFESTADLIGNNGDGNSEIFLFDVVTDTLTQVTDASAGGSGLPSISGDGTKIAFQSTADLTGNNADRNGEVFLFDTISNSLTQVTDTRGWAVNNAYAAISGDGAKIAFARSTYVSDPTQLHLASQLYLFDTATSGLTQLTVGAGPSINGDGTRIAFVRGNPWIDDNTPPGSEVFLYDTITGGLTQVTRGTDPYSASWEPSISSDGTKIAFSSWANLGGNNADGNSEIFRFDTITSSLIQVTDTRGGENYYPYSEHPVISGDGARIVFASDADLTGNNPDQRQEIFMATIGDLFAGMPNVSANAPPLAAAAVDEAVSAADSAAGVATPGESPVDLGGLREERIGGEDRTDLALPFATFADAKTDRPLPDRLVAALIAGRMSL